MCCSVLLLRGICHHWVLPPGLHGLWPPRVGPFTTPTPWPQACVPSWQWALTQTPSDSPSVVQMKSITFSAVPLHPWLSRTLTHAVSQLAVFFLLSFNGFFTFPVIFISLFTCITMAHTRSAEGRKKAISICASHLPAVSIFSGTIIVMYLQPSSTRWWTRTRQHLCFMGWVIPMLNPLIYSLRNKEVKSALWKILNKPNPQSFSVSRR